MFPKRIAEDLKSDSMRNYMILKCGIYTGRRISDILNLKVPDLKDKDTIFVRETKTKKKIILLIHRELRKKFQDYLQDRQLHEYIFKTSRKSSTPVHRSTFYKILNQAVDKYSLE
jgi:integrase